MSSLQHRVKNIDHIPLNHSTETKTTIDPRSPSADIIRYKIKIIFFKIINHFSFRTPIDLQTYQLPNVPNTHIK